MSYEPETQESIYYLSSEAAIKSIDADPYWPKWDSPWWHMLLLHEMGVTQRIPSSVIEAYVSSLKRYPVQHFPIPPEQLPADVDPYRGCPCHCQLGNVYQVLAAWGVDVDHELPWMRPWFLRYQMADGGLNCDEEAYIVKDETPSSMVGTIAAFEAILLYTDRPWTSEEKQFLQKGAEFLINRKLMLGSSTRYNSDERESAKDWSKLCFPRFYLYDVLRGLNAIVTWAEKTKQALPFEAIQDVTQDLERRFADGRVRIGRQSYAGAGTILQTHSGEWIRQQPATSFPLLNKVSIIGEESPYLSHQWAQIKSRLDNQ